MNIPENLRWGEMTPEQRTTVRMWFALGHTVQIRAADTCEWERNQRWVDDRMRWIMANNPNSVLDDWRFRIKPRD